MIWLQTVKHTGTHWMMEHLINMGLTQATVDIRTLAITGGDFIQAHMGENLEILALIKQDDIVITTMRNPIHIYQSYRKRYDLTAEEAEQRVYLSLGEWRAWAHLHDSFVVYIDDEYTMHSRMIGLAEHLNIANYQYKEVSNTTNVSVINRPNNKGPFPPTEAIIKLAKDMRY